MSPFIILITISLLVQGTGLEDVEYEHLASELDRDLPDTIKPASPPTVMQAPVSKELLKRLENVRLAEKEAEKLNDMIKSIPGLSEECFAQDGPDEQCAREVKGITMHFVKIYEFTQDYEKTCAKLYEYLEELLNQYNSYKSSDIGKTYWRHLYQMACYYRARKGMGMNLLAEVAEDWPWYRKFWHNNAMNACMNEAHKIA